MLSVLPTAELAQSSVWELSSSPLLDAAIKGVIVLLVAWTATAALRRVHASARHVVWAGAMLGLVLLPVMCALLPAWRLAVLPSDSGPSPEVAADRTTGRSAEGGAATGPSASPPVVTARPDEAAVPSNVTPDEPAVSEAVAAFPPPAEVGPAAPAFVATEVVLLAWLVGALLCLVPYLAGVARLVWVRRGASPCVSDVASEAANVRKQLGVDRDVPLLASARVHVPMVWGVLRPIVLLPTDFEAWPETRRRAVLVHELAHVRRLDCLTQLLARVAVALHWFNPLAWLAERNLRLESEKACDDLVLAAGTVPSAYADGLLAVARSLRGPSSTRVPGVAIAIARPSRLEERLVAILDPRRARGDVSPLKLLGGTIAVLLALLPLAALRLAAQESPASTGADSEPTLVVAADFASIQEAIDAAADGAVIELGPGVYEEQLRIEKPLTLVGAGWNQTTITSKYSLAFLQDRELMASIEKRMRAAKTKAEQQAVRAEIMEEYGPKPTLRVKGAKGVVIRDLKLTLQGSGEKGRSSVGSVLSLESAHAEVVRCAIAGSPANGVVVVGDSDVEIRESLIAGAWGTGIAVALDESSQGQVRVLRSDIRNCRHRGIQIGAGGKPTLVQECRITGSAWHGIRYDHCSPQIVGNLIYDNERSGIYASGKTAATVRGNLFYHDGIGCWFQNRDTIEGNTFVSARSEVFSGSGQGVCVLGASRPQVRKNVFFDGRAAVTFSNIGSDSPDARAGGKVEFQGNIFWQNDRNITWPSEDGEEELPLDEEAGNRVADPEFAAVLRRDFSLAESSFARRHGAGVVSHLSFESPWPVQPEESQVVSARDTEKREAVAASSRRTAEEKAKPWIDDLNQIQDRERRDAAVERILAALASGDPDEVHAGLVAFRRTLDATYDKAPFRDPILAVLDSVRGEARVAALYALRATGERPEDLEIVLELLEGDPSPELRRSGTHLIHTFGGGKIEGRGAALVLAFLESDDEGEVKEAMRGIWGAEVTPAIEERLIELAEPGSSTRGTAIYFGLSTLKNKSRDVVELLLATIEDQDHENGGRAVWGLGYGVPEEHHAIVADRVAEILATTSGRMRSECVGLLERYGSTPHVQSLEDLAQNDLAPEKLRAAAEKAIERVLARERRE